MEQTKGHLSGNPGLRGHSVDPENDLIKPYVYWEKVKHGWLALKSYNTAEELEHFAFLKVLAGGVPPIRLTFNDEVYYEDEGEI